MTTFLTQEQVVVMGHVPCFRPPTVAILAVCREQLELN